MAKLAKYGIRDGANIEELRKELVRAAKPQTSVCAVWKQPRQKAASQGRECLTPTP
jgi:hypothetical protein